MTCSIPAAAIRDSRWVRNGSPAVGSIGLGAERVSGRSRVPCPPTRMTASTRRGSMESATLNLSSRLPPTASDHQSRARRERAPHRPPQRRLPPPVVPIGEESVGAAMVLGQVAGRFPAGGVTLVVQNLCRGHVDVLPAGLLEPVSQVDVFHVHEIALVEAAYLIECGPTQQQARARQPADLAFAGLQPVLPV